MRAALQVPAREPTEIRGQISTPPDRFVPPRISFNDLATFAFPHKTDHHLSFHTGYDVRTCRRWRASKDGKNEPPAEALGVVLAEIMRRFHQR